MNFLANILERLRQTPTCIVMQEMRPSGRVSLTASKLLDKIAAARAFFLSAGVRRGDRCAILAANGIAWVIVDLAAMAEGIIVVPLYARQAPAELAVMLRDSQPRLVCCGDAVLLESVRATLPAGDAPALVLLDDVLSKPAGNGEGRPGAAATPVALADSDPVTIIYTSGTSGEPKGVVLTTANVTYILSRTTARLDQLMGKRTAPDRVFHYLPFCFASSWILMLSCLSRHSILRLSTDLTRISDDLRAAEPDYVVNVPALLERMRASIQSQLAARGGVAHALFRNAQAAWLRQCSGSEPRGAFSLALARRFIFPSIRKRLGGNLRALISGSGPLALDTQLFFMMLGIRVLQVYGLTETTGICTMDEPGRVEPGTVGPAIPGIEMRLGEADEILVRGPNIFPGYWNRPDETAKALHDDWFHTGDQGERTAAGNWRIVGRLKNLLVLSSGHNIAPEPLEQALLQAIAGAQQVVIFGHGRGYLTAFITGEVERARAGDAIDHLNGSLPHYRQIRGFHVEPKPLTIESGLLTANGKLRRDAVAAYFNDAIEEMYRVAVPASVSNLAEKKHR